MAGRMEYGLHASSNKAYAEGRAKAFGIGPSNPHASGSLRNVAWAAGNGFTGSRDSTPFGAAGWSTTWTPVTFDGNDQLDNPTDMGLGATFDTFTAAVAVRFTDLSTARCLIGHTSLAGLALLTALGGGGLTINTPSNLSTTGILGASVPGLVLVTGIDYIIHVAARASTQSLTVWVNGTEYVVTNGSGWLGTGGMPRPSTWSVGGLPGGTQRLVGRMGLAWFDVSQYITDPTKFAPAYDLGAQLANPGARPTLGFGGVQTVANWNAGTSLGDSTGTWTMTGAVT
jgi:hypothetical protein